MHNVNGWISMSGELGGGYTTYTREHIMLWAQGLRHDILYGQEVYMFSAPLVSFPLLPVPLETAIIGHGLLH
jgi:hypothetical protein